MELKTKVIEELGYVKMSTISNNSYQWLNLAAASQFGGEYGQLFGGALMGTGADLLNAFMSGELSDDDVERLSAELTLTTVSIMGKFITGGAEANAVQDIGKTDKRLVDSTKVIHDLKVQNNEALQAVVDKIIAEADNVQESINKLKALVGEQSKVKENQDKLDEQKRIIQAQIEIINDSEKSVGEKKAALVLISGASVVIRTLSAEVTALLADATAEGEKATASAKNIADYNIEAEGIIAQNLEAVGATVTKTSAGTINDITRQTAEGSTETVVGISLEAEAAAIAGATFGIGSAAAADLAAKGADYIAAGSTHTGGAITNMTALGASVSAWGGDYAEIGANMQVVGSAVACAYTLLGEFGVELASTMATISGWGTLIETAGTMDATVVEVKAQLDAAQAEWEQEQETPYYDKSGNDVFEEEKAQGPDTSNIKFDFDLNLLTPGLELGQQA